MLLWSNRKNSKFSKGDFAFVITLVIKTQTNKYIKNAVFKVVKRDWKKVIIAQYCNDIDLEHAVRNPYTNTHKGKSARGMTTRIN